MKRSKFTEKQIICFLKQAAVGMPIKELCRTAGFNDAPSSTRTKNGEVSLIEASGPTNCVVGSAGS